MLDDIYYSKVSEILSNRGYDRMPDFIEVISNKDRGMGPEESALSIIAKWGKEIHPEIAINQAVLVDKFKNPIVAKEQIPKTCYWVKCMLKGCNNMASHKIAELNLWNENDPEELQQFNYFNLEHNKTTYLCTNHFNKLMLRDETYYTSDIRMPRPL